MGELNKKDMNDWKQAEYRYVVLQAERMMPLSRKTMSTKDYMDGLANIYEAYHFFYPALLEHGLVMIGNNDEINGKKKMDQGLECMFEYSDEEMIEDEIDMFLDNLIILLRYDLAKEYALQLIEKYPSVSIYYDTLALCEAILGNEKESIEAIDKAIELNPKDYDYYSNKGWFYLFFGKLDEAEKSLTQALKLNENHDVTKGNIGVLNYLRKHGGNYVDFLLRPVDLEKISKYEDENEVQDEYGDDGSEISIMYTQYNHDRIKALKMVLPSEGTHVTGKVANIIETLDLFLSFVKNRSFQYFLFDDINYVQENFLDIMCAFIFRYKDVDAELVNDIFDGLTIFYSFLKERENVTNESYQALIVMMVTINDYKRNLISKLN